MLDSIYMQGMRGIKPVQTANSVPQVAKDVERNVESQPDLYVAYAQFLKLPQKRRTPKTYGCPLRPLESDAVKALITFFKAIFRCTSVKGRIAKLESEWWNRISPLFKGGRVAICLTNVMSDGSQATNQCAFYVDVHGIRLIECEPQSAVPERRECKVRFPKAGKISFLCHGDRSDHQVLFDELGKLKMILRAFEQDNSPFSFFEEVDLGLTRLFQESFQMQTTDVDEMKTLDIQRALSLLGRMDPDVPHRAKFLKIHGILDCLCIPFTPNPRVILQDCADFFAKFPRLKAQIERMELRTTKIWDLSKKRPGIESTVRSHTLSRQDETVADQKYGGKRFYFDVTQRRFIASEDGNVEHCDPWAAIEGRVKTFVDYVNNAPTSVQRRLKMVLEQRYRAYFVAEQGQIMPTEGLKNCLRKNIDNLSVMYGPDNRQKSDQDAVEWLATHSRFGSRFAQYVSGQPKPLEDLVDRSEFILRFRTDPSSVQPEFKGRGLGLAIVAYVTQRKDRTTLKEHAFLIDRKNEHLSFAGYLLDVCSESESATRKILQAMRKLVRSGGVTADREAFRNRLEKIEEIQRFLVDEPTMAHSDPSDPDSDSSSQDPGLRSSTDSAGPSSPRPIRKRERDVSQNEVVSETQEEDLQPPKKRVQSQSSTSTTDLSAQAARIKAQQDMLGISEWSDSDGETEGINLEFVSKIGAATKQKKEAQEKLKDQVLYKSNQLKTPLGEDDHAS